MAVRWVQPLKVALPRERREDVPVNVTVVRAVQPANTRSPRDSRPEASANVTDVRFVQLAKAESPILVTNEGIVTDVISVLY